MKLINFKKKYSAVAVSISAVLSSPAMADGFTKANDVLEKISTGLHGLSGVTIGIAALIVGYRTLFDGRAIMESKNILMGGAIIVSISEIIAYFVS